MIHFDRLAIGLVAAMAIACTCGCGGGDGGGKAGQDGKTAGIAADAVTVELSGQGQAEGTARLGYVKPESTHEVTFAVSNESGGDLDIVGSRTQCECMQLGEEPEIIPAGAVVPLTLRFAAPADSVSYDKWLMLLAGDWGTGAQDARGHAGAAYRRVAGCRGGAGEARASPGLRAIPRPHVSVLCFVGGPQGRQEAEAVRRFPSRQASRPWPVSPAALSGLGLWGPGTQGYAALRPGLNPDRRFAAEGRSEVYPPGGF